MSDADDGPLIQPPPPAPQVGTGRSPRPGYSPSQAARAYGRGGHSAPRDAVSIAGIPARDMTPEVEQGIATLMAEIDQLRWEVEQAESRREFLERQADEDAVAAILNRRAFQREAGALLTHAEEVGLTVMLGLFRLRNAEALHDAHGFEAVLAVFGMVARQIRAALRDTDVVGHPGGWCVGVALPVSDQSGGENKLREIAMTLEGETVGWEGNALPVGIGLGVHIAEPGDGPEWALARADADERRQAATR